MSISGSSDYPMSRAMIRSSNPSDNGSLLERARRKIQDDNHERLVGEMLGLQERIEEVAERQAVTEEQLMALNRIDAAHDQVKHGEDNNTDAYEPKEDLAEQVRSLRQLVEQQAVALLENDRRVKQQQHEISELRQALEGSTVSTSDSPEAIPTGGKDIRKPFTEPTPQQRDDTTEAFKQTVTSVLVEHERKITDLSQELRGVQRNVTKQGLDIAKNCATVRNKDDPYGTTRNAVLIYQDDKIERLEAQLGKLELATRSIVQQQQQQQQRPNRIDNTDIHSIVSGESTKSFGLPVKGRHAGASPKGNTALNQALSEKSNLRMDDLTTRLAVLERRKQLEDLIEAAPKFALEEYFYKLDKEWKLDMDADANADPDADVVDAQTAAAAVAYEFDVGEKGRFILRQRVLERLSNWDAVQKTFREDVRNLDFSIYENREPGL